MALYKLSDKLKEASSNVKKQLDNFGKTDAGESIKSALQNISPFPGQETSLRGVTGNTKDKLNQYSGDYQASESVTNALKDKQQANDAVMNYGPYESQYQQQLDDIYNKIMNREDFSYDMNSDALYNQYKDQYQALGQTAMADTMAQASALTGGYGNTYASTVGNQAYQGYLSQLNDKIPQLYQLALDTYARQGDDLYNQYSLTASADDRAYGQYMDAYNRLVANRDYYANEYNNEYNRDYGQFADNRAFWQNQAQAENADYWQNKEFNYGALRDAANFGYNAFRDTVSDAWNAANFGYGMYRDSVADSQWDKTFNYNAERDKIADNQWQQTFDYGKERDQVADNQWQQTFDYGKQRDQVADSQWQKTFDYNANRDLIADQQWQKTFDYNAGRDKVADSQWEKTYNYNASRDKVADSQWQKQYDLQKKNLSSGSGYSGSSSKNSGSTTKTTTEKTTETPAVNKTASNTAQPKNNYTGITQSIISDVSKSVSSKQAAGKIDLYERNGYITSEEADRLYDGYITVSKSSITLF